jgi:hypothetical protein
MSRKIDRFLSVGVGVIGGIALVVSCGDRMKHLSAQEDMSSPNCGGSCSVSGPISISSVQQPVTVTAEKPIPVSGDVRVSGTVGVSGSVAVSGIASAISVAGPLKVITADSDANQLRNIFFGGTATAALTLLVKGPFVITDLQMDENSQDSANVFIGVGVDCSSSLSMPRRFGVSSPRTQHSGRIVVPAGYVACGNGGAPAMLSGFVPYL